MRDNLIPAHRVHYMDSRYHSGEHLLGVSRVIFGLAVVLAIVVVLIPGLANAGCYEDELADAFAGADQEFVPDPLSGRIVSIEELKERIRRKETESFYQQLGRPLIRGSADSNGYWEIREGYSSYQTFPSNPSLPCREERRSE